MSMPEAQTPVDPVAQLSVAPVAQPLVEPSPVAQPSGSVLSPVAAKEAATTKAEELAKEAEEAAATKAAAKEAAAKEAAAKEAEEAEELAKEAEAEPTEIKDEINIDAKWLEERLSYWKDKDIDEDKRNRINAAINEKLSTLPKQQKGNLLPNFRDLRTGQNSVVSDQGAVQGAAQGAIQVRGGRKTLKKRKKKKKKSRKKRKSRRKRRKSRKY